MKIAELLHEARRNADINPRVDALSVLSAQYNKKNRFVSYTRLPKLGINPRSNFDTTPLGVYGYPIKYLLNRAYKKGSIVGAAPFASEYSPYVIGFSIRGNIHNTNDQTTSANIKKALAYIRKVHQNDDMFEEEALEFENDTDFGIFYECVKRSAIRMQQVTDKRATVILSDFCRNGLGWDAIVDDGNGHVHKNEPYQCVVLNTRAIYDIEIHDNVDARVRDDLRNGSEFLAMHQREFKELDRMYSSMSASSEMINKAAETISSKYNKLMTSWLKGSDTVKGRAMNDLVLPELNQALVMLSNKYETFYRISGNPIFSNYDKIRAYGKKGVTFMTKFDSII